MLSNILIATGFFGMGFLIGMMFMTAMTIKKYKKNPKEFILILEQNTNEK